MAKYLNARLGRRVFLQGVGCCLFSQLIGRNILEAQNQPLSNKWTERVIPLMGSYFSIAISGFDRTKAFSVIEQAFSYADKLVSLISEWQQGSLLSELNQTRIIKADNYLLNTLLLKSKLANSYTRGEFKALSKELTNYWKGLAEQSAAPKKRELEPLLSDLKRSDIVFRDDCIRLIGPNTIDTGGIGKGFVVEECMRFLSQFQLEAVRIAAAGDIKYYGKDAAQVEIEDPLTEGYIGKISLASGMSISTSAGKYTKWISDGRLYHHLIELNKGYPINLNKQVSVIYNDATLADALATGFFSLAVDQIFQIANNISGCQVIVIDQVGHIHLSRGLRLS